MACAAMLASVVPGLALRAPATTPRVVRYVPNQVIVRFDAAAPVRMRSVAHALRGARVLERIDELNADLVHVPGDPPAVASAYLKLPGVAGAEPNYEGRIAAAPPPSRANDPLVRGIGPTWIDRQWYLTRIAAPTAWTIHPRVYFSARSKPRDVVKVAVLDTWIDTEHNDWRNAGGNSVDNSRGGQLDMADARSFVERSRLRGPHDWHGTHVAGIIGASTDNSLDMAGIAYASQIMPVPVADGSGSTNAFRLAQGIAWAVARGAKVINISLTIRADAAGVETLRAAVNRAVARRAVVIAALGNGGGDDAEYPAGFAVENPHGVVAVGATGLFDTRAPCSKKGRHITLSAPGEAMWSLDPQDHTVQSDRSIRRETCGTSFSTAVVSGVAALVAGRYRGIRPAEIVRRLVLGSDDIAPAGRDDETGAGRVNAERALWPGIGPGATWRNVPVADTGRITVTALAQSAGGVGGAEVLVDGTPRTRGVRAWAADGTFAGRSEALSASLDVSRLGEGPHEVFVRAHDRRGVWGPASAAVLLIDRSPPSVSQPRTWPMDTGVIYPDDNPGVRFQISDAWSRMMFVKVVLLDGALRPAVSLVFPALPTMMVELKWKDYFEKANDGPVLPGGYRVIATAIDLAGHESYNEAPIVVLPTARMVPSPGSSQGPGGLPAPGVPSRLPTAMPSNAPAPTVTPAPMPSGTISPSSSPVPLPTGTPTGG